MNNFDKNWRNAKKSIFRLEGRAEYRLLGDWENFEKWKKGDFDAVRGKGWQEWLGSLKKANAKGIAVQRVRVVTKPLSDYVKYESDLWQKYPAKQGEAIFFLDANEYQQIIAGYGFDPKDFWLFDDQNLLIFNFGKTGQFTGDISITNGGMVKRYCELKHKLLEKAKPMEQFFKTM